MVQVSGSAAFRVKHAQYDLASNRMDLVWHLVGDRDDSYSQSSTAPWYAMFTDVLTHGSISAKSNSSSVSRHQSLLKIQLLRICLFRC